MNKTDALNHFGGATNLSRSLGLTPHAVYQWAEKVPARSQWRIAILSNWELMPDPELLPDGVTAESLKGSTEINHPQVSKLTSIANDLAQKGRGDVLDALITMAEHNL